MTPALHGLHHLTATTAGAQADVDFYTGLLGMRLVKKTVNFDGPGVYHFYYGDARGAPGSVMTTFPYAGRGVRVGTKGAGQITETAFSVPPDALPFWADRLGAAGVETRSADARFGEPVLAFEDPSGLTLELVASERAADSPWESSDVSPEHAVRGLHHVTLRVAETGPTRAFLEDVLGLREAASEATPGKAEGLTRTRFDIGAGGSGRQLDLVHDPEAAPARNGLGTVHHVALAIGTEAEQLVLHDHLAGLGFHVTDVLDRQYFRSIYVREPGGILVEIATVGPGFLVDEPAEALGRGLMLPPWEEPRRAEIEAALPPLRP